jgi:hypothetical protein
MTWFQTAARRIVSTLLTVLTLSVFAPEPVRAGIDACFTAIAPAGQISKAGEIAAKAGGCASAAAGNPTMAMTIAALIAAAAADQFSTSDECKSVISGSVGKLIAKALLEVMPEGFAKDILQDFVDGKLPGVTFSEVLLSIPGGQLIAGYIECGCAVAGAKGDVEKLIDEYKEAAEDCANFASDAVSIFADPILSGGASVGEWIHSGLHGSGTTGEVDCWPTTVLPDGVWTAQPITTGPPEPCDGNIICKPGHVVQKIEIGGKKLSKCAAGCPPPTVNNFTPGDTCYSQTVWMVSNGVCEKGGKGACCGGAEAMFEWGKCEPVCSEGGGLQNGKCAPCKHWQTAALNRCHNICPNGVYYDPNAPVTPTVSLQSSPGPLSATGASIPGQGTSGSPGFGNIVAIPGGAKAPPGKGGATLAPGVAGLPGAGGAKPPPGEKLSLQPMCIPCGSNEYVQNNQCHNCGPAAILNKAKQACTPCAEGHVAKLMAGALTCAADCSKVVVAGKQSDTMSANYITNPDDKNRCIACKRGTQPNAAHTACIVFARSTPEKESFTAKSVPAKTPTKETPKGTVAKIKATDEPKGAALKSQCPPRTHPNPRGTGCVPDLDMPEFGGGSSAPRSGGTRGTPGGFGIMVPGR